MTRFLLSIDKAVDVIFTALAEANRGETYIPIVPSARMIDLAEVMVEASRKKIEIKITGIRPGEKIHEILVSQEEGYRTVRRGDYYAILPMLPEIAKPLTGKVLNSEYSSSKGLMSKDELRALLQKEKLIK
jgi:UDP-glucose 4-epimerase